MASPASPWPGAWRQFALGAGAVAAACVLDGVLVDRVADSDLVMVLLLAVVVVAFRVELPAAVFTALASVAAFDFFFVEPRFDFAVSEARYLITFVVMAALGVTVSALSIRFRRQIDAARRAEVAAATERVRSGLLSSVSHDLRTPLGTIVGATSTLLSAPPGLGPAARRELLQSVHDEADRLARLLANLLEMTRIEGGAVVVRRELQVPEEIVGAALARCGAELGGRVVEVDLPDGVLVDVDAGLLEIVLVNLIDNAIRHAPGDTAIAITGSVRDRDFELTVADRGPGFAPDERARVFEKFYRGRAIDRRGSGLGLAIAKAVVDAHGGTIVAETRRDGPGACIRIVLPAVCSRADADRDLVEAGAEP